MKAIVAVLGLAVLSTMPQRAGRLPLPAGTVASSGPPKSCVVDKAKQFADELGAPGTDPKERLFALKFLLHFAGDMHQPLHSSDNNDRGGNEVKVSTARLAVLRFGRSRWRRPRTSLSSTGAVTIAADLTSGGSSVRPDPGSGATVSRPRALVG
jgi:hypothetical protein